ncbi:CHAP domain-containing protein [Enterobacter cloacae complex sp. P47BA]|uniref:CHAP domain-containing protein n=1 Tax=Enterobacter TaxID=547 RepID=UPI00351C789E
MWSAHKAAVYARQHAGEHSQKRCAEFVSKAIRAGGANLQNTHYAKDMKSNLILAGFHQIYGEPVEGDVAVIQPTAHPPYGHACIFASGTLILFSEQCIREKNTGK